MATTATPETHSRRVLVDGEPTPVEIDSTVSLEGQRLDIESDGASWVYIVDHEHCARFETASDGADPCPDWLDRLLRELGALDVEVQP